MEINSDLKWIVLINEINENSKQPNPWCTWDKSKTIKIRHLEYHKITVHHFMPEMSKALREEKFF